MRFKSILAASGLLMAFAAALATPALAQYGAGSPAITPVCANCHEYQHLSTTLTAHGAKNDANGSMCAACHGDASAHLQDPMKAKPASAFKKGVPAAQKDAVCQTCHAGNRHLVFWERASMRRTRCRAVSCHSIHGKPGPVVVAPFTTSFRPNESDLCGTCHQQVRAATLKPSHHPIIENKIKCSDCHNVARRAHAGDAEGGDGEPAVLLLPRRQARAVPVRAPGGRGELPVLPQPAWLGVRKLLNEKVPNLCQDCHDCARHPGTVYGAAGELHLYGRSDRRSDQRGLLQQGARRVQQPASTRA